MLILFTKYNEILYLSTMNLQDTHGRISNYLRLGITDRCNLRCRYCMPEEGIDFSNRQDLLSYEEILRLSKIFEELGVQKIRLTGGEPFVRKDIIKLIGNLTNIFSEVHITTNATLLSEHILTLKEKKISGLNISIDSLDRERFLMITRRDNFDMVMTNIMACLSAKIPTKLNVVVMKGVNDMEVLDFVNFGLRYGIIVRFIEAMPFNEYDGNKSVFMSASEIETLIRNEYDIEKLNKTISSSAETYTVSDKSIIDIIPAYSRSLCGSCNRIRLTPKGELLTCLYSIKGSNLLKLIRDRKTSDDHLKKVILDAVIMKKATGHEEEALRNSQVFESMTTIGG